MIPPTSDAPSADPVYWMGVGISISEINLGKGENRNERSQNPKSKDHKVI